MGMVDRPTQENHDMNKLIEVAAEEFAVYTAAESLSDWGHGYDDAGQPVFDGEGIEQHLCREVY